MRFGFKYNGEEHKLEAKGSYAIAPELTVEVERLDIPEFDAVKWTLWFSDPSDRNSGILSEIYDCDTVLPLKGDPYRIGYQATFGNPCVTTFRGILSPEGREYTNGSEIVAEEFAPRDVYLRDSAEIFENAGRGRSSDGMMPFFNVHAGGTGAMMAIGWSGDWRATFAAVEQGICVRAGLQHTHFYLKPGEKIRTASILIMNYGAGEDCSNKFRRLIATHFSHRSHAPEKPDGLLAAIFWGALPSDEMKNRIRRLHKAGVPFEAHWIDAGWYGDVDPAECPSAHQGSWPKFTGDWRIGKRCHPDGLRDVKAELAKEGQRIMLWVEPERIHESAVGRVEALRAHPEWLLKDPCGESYLLYYGASGAVDYVFETISGLIESLDICCYRQDFNMDPAPTFRKYESEDRQGIVEIKHICGVYELFDRLLARFPDLWIDNCASGGRRIDLETLSQSIVICRSDYLCQFDAKPEIVQTHSTNLSAYLPYTGCFYRGKLDPYGARSFYASSFGWANYGNAFLTLDDEDLAAMRRLSEEYLRIRMYFSKDFYNHGSNKYDLTSWAIWQFHDPETGSGIVMAFRRPQSPFAQAAVSLKGIPSAQTLLFESSDDGSTFRSGADIVITLDKPRSSTVLLYKKA